MFDFSNVIDLPLVWALIIGMAIFFYVLLDGFDLGVGIISPFAPSDQCRDRMINSIAPFWDGNETWLILGGGGLFIAFPVAYSILLPAFYMPIIMMLLCLIMRGVAFEFRFKSGIRDKKVWDGIFHVGSLGAAFFQGAILGDFIQGVEVVGHDFGGGPFDWANGFSLVTGIAVIFGYSLLGATWTVMKTDSITQDWARKVALYSLFFIAIFIALVTVIMFFVEDNIKELWFSFPKFYYLLPIPLMTMVLFIMLFFDLLNKVREIRPFLLSIGIFFLSYLGLAISLYPWMVPFHYDIWQTASYGPSLSLMLVVAVFLIPVILCYVAFSYYVFRGKVSHEDIHY